MGSRNKTNLNLMRLRRGLTRRRQHSSVSQQVADFDEEKAAGRIIGRALRGDEGRRSGTQVEIAIAVVVPEINRRTGMQQISEKHVGRELLGGRERPIDVIGAAETPLQIEELRVGDGGVVVQNEPQGQFLCKLIIQLRAIQVVVENAVPRGKGRRHRAFTGSQPVIDQRLRQPETGRWPQRESQVHTPRISKKRLNGHERLSGKEVLSDALRVPRGKGNPFVRLSIEKDRGTVFPETDAFEKFVGLAAADVDGRLLLQVHLKTESHSPVLKDAGVVPVHRFADRGSEIDDFTFVRPPEIAAEDVVLPEVDAIHEPQLGAEIWRKVVVVGGKSEMPAGIRCVGPQRIALLRPNGRITAGRKRQAFLFCVEILPRPGMHPLNVDDPVPGEFQARIERGYAIAGVRKIAARKKSANVGLIAELARHAHHPVHRPRAVGATRDAQARLAVVDDQGAEGPFAEFSRHTRAELRVGDLTREKEIDRRREKSGVLDKERPLLRKKNGEALIDGDLRVVGFYLAEIGIQSDVERERIFKNEFGVEPGAMFELVLKRRRRSGIWRIHRKWLIQKMVVRKNPVGNKLNIAAR